MSGNSLDPKVIILAGGLGTRLRGALGDLPKPLAPIGGKPVLEYLINFISHQGFREIIISCGHGAGAVRDYFGDGSTLGLRIRYTFEEELLGTGGAIKLAEPLVDSRDFIVANGDTYFEVSLTELLQFHRARGALATLALTYRKEAGRYGTVLCDDDNRVVTFTEKAKEERAGLINGGVYVFGRAIFDYIPAGRACSLEREILPLLVGRGLYGFPADGYFIDIGVPEDYERAKEELPARRSL
jgi:NDP-sugar pyrophosphorylase family protein